jgi:hypothetical protein
MKEINAVLMSFVAAIAFGADDGTSPKVPPDSQLVKPQPNPNRDRGPHWVKVRAAHSEIIGLDGKTIHVRTFHPVGRLRDLPNDIRVRWRDAEYRAHIFIPIEKKTEYCLYMYAFAVPGRPQGHLYIEDAYGLTTKEPKVPAECHPDCGCPHCPRGGARLDGTRPCKGCDECDGVVVEREEYPAFAGQSPGMAQYRICRGVKSK